MASCRHFRAALLGAALLLSVTGAGTAAGPGEFEPNAAVVMSPEIPADVDPAMRDALLSRGEIMLAHRLFERQQWTAFIALNWPVDALYRPHPRLGDAGNPAWTEWIESFEVFRQNGGDPAPWGAATHTPPDIHHVQRPVADALMPLGTPAISSRGSRVLTNLSAIARVQVDDEVDQAFSFAVWDKNGNPAHYEILVNKPEYDFIVQNGLFNAGGIADYMQRSGGISFPAGRFSGNRLGAMEVKLAWRILDPKSDDFSRYLVQPAYLPDWRNGQPTWTPVTVGLVGFHIAQKTETSPQWIWSTFEHVDNLATDALTQTKTQDGSTVPLAPSFNDPACQWCPVNVPALPGAGGKRRTQIARLQPVAGETEALNAIVRAQLREAGSVLQYYKMIGTQWPTMPELKRGEGVNGAVANISGGLPLPTYLANSVMETFAQVGNTTRPSQEGFPTRTGDRQIFVNGSCMGCHASSPYDFNWILTQAQPRQEAEPPLPPPSSP